jgi:hypothetical protein
MTGRWLDAVRRGVITEVGADPSRSLDPDSDEAFAAYNRMLQRLAGPGNDRDQGPPDVISFQSPRSVVDTGAQDRTK